MLPIEHHCAMVKVFCEHKIIFLSVLVSEVRCVFGVQPWFCSVRLLKSIPAVQRSFSPQAHLSTSPAPAGQTSLGALNERRAFHRSTLRTKVPPPAYWVWRMWRGDTRVFMRVLRTAPMTHGSWPSLCLVRQSAYLHMELKFVFFTLLYSLTHSLSVRSWGLVPRQRLRDGD